MIVGDFEIDIPCEFHRIEVRSFLPGGLDSKGSYWYQGPNKKFLVWLPKIESFLDYLTISIGDQATLCGYSVIAFFIADFQKVHQYFYRHRFLFLMWWHQICNCPFYLISPSVYRSTRKCSKNICDYICSLYNC